MKQLLVYIMILVVIGAITLAFGLGSLLGGLSVIHSEGYVDGDTFVVDWMGNEWVWDISNN